MARLEREPELVCIGGAFEVIDARGRPSTACAALRSRGDPGARSGRRSPISHSAALYRRDRRAPSAATTRRRAGRRISTSGCASRSAASSPTFRISSPRAASRAFRERTRGAARAGDARRRESRAASPARRLAGRPAPGARRPIAARSSCSRSPRALRVAHRRAPHRARYAARALWMQPASLPFWRNLGHQLKARLLRGPGMTLAQRRDAGLRRGALGRRRGREPAATDATRTSSCWSSTTARATAPRRSSRAFGDPRIRLLRKAARGLLDLAARGRRARARRASSRAWTPTTWLAPAALREAARLPAPRHPECVALGSEVLLIDPEGRPLGERGVPLRHEAIEAELLAGARRGAGASRRDLPARGAARGRELPARIRAGRGSRSLPATRGEGPPRESARHAARLSPARAEGEQRARRRTATADGVDRPRCAAPTRSAAGWQSELPPVSESLTEIDWWHYWARIAIRGRRFSTARRYASRCCFASPSSLARGIWW